MVVNANNPSVVLMMQKVLEEHDTDLSRMHVYVVMTEADRDCGVARIFESLSSCSQHVVSAKDVVQSAVAMLVGYAAARYSSVCICDTRSTSLVNMQIILNNMDAAMPWPMRGSVLFSDECDIKHLILMCDKLSGRE